jgi:dihydroorotate dehydrogenase electron transfer subunit
MNPLSAAHYADQAGFHSVRVAENEPVARDTYRLRVPCPPLARRIRPGQFVMLRLADCNDPLLGRALALFDTYTSPGGEAIGLEVVYLVVGKLTGKLARFTAGQPLELWGPLGNGFAPQPVEHLILVAGGIGMTPLMAVARQHLGLACYGDPATVVAPAERVSLCYGARTADYLAYVDRFERLGVEVRLSTDDGSRGHHGLVTDTLRGVLDERGGESRRILCCGPEPMMAAVAQIAEQADVPCDVSLETPMACGIGICFSCVAKVKDAVGGWDYKRTCVEGPVFDAWRLVW